MRAKLAIVSTSRRAPRQLAPIASAPYARIEEGNYIALCTGAQIERARKYGRNVVHLRFAIPAEGVGLSFFCNLGTRDNLKYRNRHRGPASKFYKAWAIASGRTPREGEEMVLAVFVDKTFRAKVRTVLNDHEQDELAAPLRYSVVDKLLELVG
jgi:hypothetical protein